MTASSATKKRCWTFHVTGVNRKKGSKIKEASVLSSFRERYTAVRRLALSSSTTTTTNAGVSGAKGSPGGVGSSKTVCIEVQFIGPQPSQGPGALLCNLLSGTSVEARPIELRRGRDNNNKRKRTDSGSDEGSDPEAEDGRVGKPARPDVLRRQNGLLVKRPSLLAGDISPGRHPPQAQDIRSHRDDIATYIKVSDELEQVPAPRTRPVYLTPLSLKALAAFPAHPSTPLNEIPPSTPPSEVPPSSPPSDDVSVPAHLPFLTARTDAALPPLEPRNDAPPPFMATRTDALPLSTSRNDAPLPFLTPRNSVIGLPGSNSRNGGVPSPLSTSSKGTASLTPPRGGALRLPPSTLRNNDAGASRPTPSNENAAEASSSSPDTRMHWEDVIGRINVPPPSRGVLGRQHSLDIGDIGSSSDGDGDGDGDFDDATDREFFSSAGSSSKGSEYDEEDAGVATAAIAATAQGRITSHHIDWNAGGVGCATTPSYDPPLTFDIADELLDPPSGSVHQRGLPSGESARSFSCAREILRGAGFQCSEHIGLDDSHGSYGTVVDGDAHKDGFAQHSRDSSTSSGLGSAAVLSGCGADGSAEGVHRVSLPPTPALVSCGATGQPNVVVGLAREFQECDFEGHHLPSLSTAPAFSGGHYQVVIDGLETVGHAPHDLVATAHFSVDSSYKVGRRASPIRIGANGKSHAALFYPSMQDVWPEVYITSNIRTVEVDVTVDIRSRDGTFHHTTPNLKVIYRRTPFYCTEESR